MKYYLLALFLGFDGNTTFIMSEPMTLKDCLAKQKEVAHIEKDDDMKSMRVTCVNKELMKQELAR